MKLYKDFEEKMKNDFYNDLLDGVIANGSLTPLYSGDVLKEELGIDPFDETSGIDDDKWYFCNDTFHGGPFKLLSDVSEEEYEQIAEDVEISYAEAHDCMVYFDEYSGDEADELEPKFVDELKKYYDEADIKGFWDSDTAAWLLDGYAFRVVFPKLFEHLKGVGK